MAPSQIALAKALNELVDAGRVVITETRARLAVNQLNGTEAEAIVDLLEADGWHDVLASDAGGEIPRNLLPTSGEGVRVTAVRMPLPDGVEAVLTKSGFGALLDRPSATSVVWVHGLRAPVETLSVLYAPWGIVEPFVPLDAPANPARVVRVLGPSGPGDQIGRWLLRSSDQSAEVEAMAPWKERATKRLLASLAQEIESDARLLFRGPPPTRFSQTNGSIDQTLFATLQSTAGWVYENSRELDNRHGLLAAEVARTSLRDGSLKDLAVTLPAALESAKIAYNFGVTQQSKDTLKALSDLRKSVSDDTAKLSETTRSLGGAVISAVFGNIGLIVARLTLPTNGAFIGPAAMLIGIVLTIYVGAVIASGAHYIAIQRDLRNDWRFRLYRFLGDDEYNVMVTLPAKRAERAFWGTAIAGALMTVFLLIAVYFIAAAPPVSAEKPRGTSSQDAVERLEPTPDAAAITEAPKAESVVPSPKLNPASPRAFSDHSGSYLQDLK
ncbi:hypothetical protein [Porphyrobacter sp. YT40]|uniref:hypothetical protein n=1 Tax=Porphyrobacter sp. YT40 TaxID=2547601 RepID=UPI001144CAD2|nr:hypothetical protein [Porphyrobacter sp. YT40]QDH35105.1 hypothetical protein E2E27_12705 [Porphyrobacter sp. YT40]